MKFQTKLLLVFAFLLLAVVGFMVFFNLQSERRLLEEVEGNMQEVVGYVITASQKLSVEKGADPKALQDFVERVKSERGVREVSVVSDSQKVLASSNPRKVGLLRRPRHEPGLHEGPDLDSALRDSALHHRPAGRKILVRKEVVLREQYGPEDSTGHMVHYVVTLPLISNQHVIGRVDAIIGVNDVRSLFEHFYLENFTLALGALLLTFAISFFLLQNLNKPLRRLSAAAESVASGDLTVQLRDQGRNRDEVGRLTSSFNAMIGKLAEQKQLEDKLRGMERRAILAEMASNLAHEIRNPLNLINLTADHLGNRFQPEDPARRQAYLDLIASLKAEVKHLNHRVAEFLTFGKPVVLDKRRFNLRDFLEQVEMLIKQQLATKGVRLEVDCPPRLEMVADREQMRLVFLNLLLNAVEAVPHGGSIKVEVAQGFEAAPGGAPGPGRGEVRCAVSDTGPGIDAASLPRIFEPYFTKRAGGTGLGLALVRRIVEEHGGKIKVMNDPGGGARFEFTVPGQA